MGWEDRPYYRDGRRSSLSPLSWILSGSIPMFTLFGIRVRAHSSLVIFVLWTILLSYADGFSLQTRAYAMAMLTTIIILHEFGHCFMARWLGGTADDILMTPIGGVAFASPPHRPLPSFLTSAAGPAVNVVICALCALGVHSFAGVNVHFNPYHPLPPMVVYQHAPAYYLWWIFNVSYYLLLFNLLPIYPLDMGQMIQAVLWPMTGYHRSMMISTTLGMVGSGLLVVFGIRAGDLMLIILAGFLFYNCYQRRMFLKESGSEEWSDGVDYSQSLFGPQNETRRRRRISRRAIRRARKIARQESEERQRIDVILAKVSAHGMHSLNWFERRSLRKATERQRRRDLELSRYL